MLYQKLPDVTWYFISELFILTIKWLPKVYSTTSINKYYWLNFVEYSHMYLNLVECFRFSEDFCQQFWVNIVEVYGVTISKPSWFKISSEWWI